MNENDVKPLINLEPIAAGTDLVESLESYVHRLADAHRVPRYFVDLLVEGNTDTADKPKRAKKPTCLNTPSEAVQKYVQRLVDLTSRAEIRNLGLGLFNSALSRLGVNRDQKAWCAGCFAEWREDKKISYWPQLWSFPQYTVCHRHNIPLNNKCLRCGARFNSGERWRGELDICSTCKAPLFTQAKEGETKNKETTSEIRKIPDYAELAAHALAELVSSVKTITENSFKVGTKFSLLMEHCQKHNLANTPADLARVTHLSRPTIHNLQHNEHTPSLDNLLRIAVICEVSLAGLLCSDLWESSASGHKLEGQCVKLPSLSKRVYYDWDAIEQQVLASIEAGNAEVPWVMARSMGLCEKQFCLKLGKTVYRLRSAAESLKLSEKEDVYKVMKAQLTEEFELAFSNRERRGRIAMAKKLNIGPHNPIFVRAHDEVVYSSMNKWRRGV